MGCGVVENREIVSMTWAARDGFVVNRPGIGEIPLHEVRIRVLDGFTKHPTLSPFAFNVSQRKGRSGR